MTKDVLFVVHGMGVFEDGWEKPIRAKLEHLRLSADTVLPAEAQRKADEMKARSDAAPIAADGDSPQALSDLIASLERFAAHKGRLHPHFAYGALDHPQYAHAHVLHVRNHLSEFVS